MLKLFDKIQDEDNRIDEMEKRLGRFNWLLSFLFNSSSFFLLGTSIS